MGNGVLASFLLRFFPRVPCQDRGHPSPLSRLNGKLLGRYEVWGGRLVGKAGPPSGELGQDCSNQLCGEGYPSKERIRSR